MGASDHSGNEVLTATGPAREISPTEKILFILSMRLEAIEEYLALKFPEAKEELPKMFNSAVAESALKAGLKGR